MAEATGGRLVAFDLDGTLTVRDTFVPFVARVAGRGGAIRAAGRRPVSNGAAIVGRDRDRLKANVVAATFAGRASEDASAMGRAHAEMVCGGWLRPDVVRRLRRHQSEGAVVVIVTASLGLYAHPIGRLLGVDGVVSTQLEERDGVLTGRLEGPNCRGPAKVEGLRSWATEHGLHGAPLTHAYGDSAGDAELLAVAEQAFRVGSARWRQDRA